MPVIGTFQAVKDGYAGSIRTLMLNGRVEDPRQRPQDERRRAGLPHLAGDDRDRRRLAQDQAGHRPDLPARAPRRPGLAAADLGGAARKHRGRPRAADLAPRHARGRFRQCAVMVSTHRRLAPRARRSQRRCKPGWSPDRSASPLDPPGRSAIEREEASGTTSLASRGPPGAAALCGGLLSLLPVPLHQRADRRRPRGRAGPYRGRPRPAHVRVLPGICRGAAPLRRAPRPVRAAAHRQRPAPRCRRRLAPVRPCRRRGNAPCRPRPDRPRRRRRPDGRPQGHRPVVPARARRPRQRLVHHAGRARRPVGDRTGRGGGAGSRLARAVRRSRRGLGGRGAAHPARRAGEEVADADRCLTEDRLPRHLPGPALPAHRPPGGAGRRHVLLAAGPVGGALARRR